MESPGHWSSRAKNRDGSNRQDEFLAAIAVFGILSAITVMMRLYTRIFIVRSLYSDDWAILLALISNIALSTGAIMVVVKLRLGFHHWDIDYSTFTPNDFSLGSKFLAVTWLVYHPVLTFAKASILLTYLRLYPGPRFRKFVWVTICVNAAFGLAVSITTLRQCRPVAYLWDKNIKGGRCLDGLPFYVSSASISTLLDAWILIMFMPVIYKMHLPLRRRLGVMCIFAVGLVVVVISVLRIDAFFRLFKTNDLSYNEAIIWSPIECSLAIIAACCHSLPPLFKHHFPNLFGTYKPNGGGAGFVGKLANLTDSSGSRGKRKDGAGPRAGLELDTIEHPSAVHLKGNSSHTHVSATYVTVSSNGRIGTYHDPNPRSPPPIQWYP